MHTCKSCGSGLPVQARFCGMCGYTQPAQERAENDGEYATILSSSSISFEQPSDVLLYPPSYSESFQEQSVPQHAAEVPLEENPYRTIPLPGSCCLQPLPCCQHVCVSHNSQALGQPALPVAFPQPPEDRESAKGGRRIRKKWLIISLMVVVVLVTTSISLAMYWLACPRPVLSISSRYNAQGLPVAAEGTVLHIEGEKFSSDSAITLLVDGMPIPHQQPIKSDRSGDVILDVVVSKNWRVGRRTITAKDARNYSTFNSTIILVVYPGQAHTPGPDGAPSDDASFFVTFSVEGATTDGRPLNDKATLVVTGHPTSLGGTVCGYGDYGQDFVTTGTTFEGSEFHRTARYSCLGTYRGGKIAFTERLESQVIIIDGYVTCRLNTAQIAIQIFGSYSKAQQFSGTITYADYPKTYFTCDVPGWSYYETGGTGTWTGVVEHE